MDSSSRNDDGASSFRPKVIVTFGAKVRAPQAAPAPQEEPYVLPRAIAPWLGIGTLATLTGACVGAIVGPVGIMVGASFGVGIGAVAALFLSREEARSTSRTRELDAIIGTTTGTLGIGNNRYTIEAHARRVQAEMRDSWGPECLTPPPPLAGSF